MQGGFKLRHPARKAFLDNPVRALPPQSPKDFRRAAAETRGRLNLVTKGMLEKAKLKYRDVVAAAHIQRDIDNAKGEAKYNATIAEGKAERRAPGGGGPWLHAHREGDARQGHLRAVALAAARASRGAVERRREQRGRNRRAQAAEAAAADPHR